MDEAALLCTCVYHGEMALLRRLLHAGAHVDSGDYDKRTALHIAAGGPSPYSLILHIAYSLAASRTHAPRLACFAVEKRVRRWHAPVLHAWVRESEQDSCDPPMLCSAVLCSAAAEGNLPAVELLVTFGGADVGVLDRWGGGRLGLARVEPS